MKKTISVMLVILVLLLTFSSASFAEGETEVLAEGVCGAEGDNLTWTLDSSKTLTIRGTGNMMDYTEDNKAPWPTTSLVLTCIVEPGVESIGDYAFARRTALRAVTIPDTVTRIGSHAFENCGLLPAVSIPDSVTSLGRFAFSECRSLSDVRLSGNLKEISPSLFWGCSALKSIEIRSGVTTIGDSAFSNTALTDIVLPEGVTYIDMHAFSNCGVLKSVTIPLSVKTIGYMAFYYCTKLTDVYYPGSQTQWSQISIARENDHLMLAEKHYDWNPDQAQEQPKNDAPNLSFFARLLQLIKDFFAKLFGKK